MGDSRRTGEESEDDDTSSTEGLIEEEEEDQAEEEADHKDAEVVDLEIEAIEEDLDLLDSAFLREGITLEQEKESSQSDDDSDGLYDFKDTLGVQQFPSDIDPRKHFLLNPRQPRQSEYLYGKRYTARCVRKVDPSQLPSLMSLKVEPPERATSTRQTLDDESELSKLVQKLQKTPGRRRRSSPDASRRKRSPQQRGRPRSRSPIRRLATRERIHRSPTGIERYRYWTGREYRSRNRSPIHRRSRHQ